MTHQIKGGATQNQLPTGVGKRSLKKAIFSISLALISTVSVKAAETAAPADPPWGTDPVVNTLLLPGIVAHTVGTLVTPKSAADGDHVLKLYDTRSATLSPSRPVQTPDTFTHHNWDIGSIGNVYGLAIDNDRNIYTTASTHYSSYFGFEAGNAARINFGSIGAGVAADTAGTDNNPGDLNDLAAAGTIYKVDKITGEVSVFAQLPQTAHSFVQNGCEENNPINRNTGPALGNIAYDKIHNQFFVSNFEDGMIYRLDTAGTQLSTFQPAGYTGLVPNGATTSGKSPYGLAVSPDGKKLYFGTNEINTSPRLFAVDLDASGDFSGTEVDQNAQLGTDLEYTQNIGGQFVGAEPPVGNRNPPVWVSYSDLQFTPHGELIIGLRTGCRGSLATSHNHGGAFYLLKQDANGKYNTPADKVPGNGTNYSGVPDTNTSESTRAGSGRYDAGAIPIYSTKVAGPAPYVHQLGTGPDDGYGGVAIYDKGDGSYDYLVTSSDMTQEQGPHGFMLFPDNFTINTTISGANPNVLSPLASFPSLPSSTTSSGVDYKGIGGDIEVLSVLVDWGDAPDTYSTDLISGNATGGSDVKGPTHILTAEGILLGSTVDYEFNGAPSIGADGDDTAGSPDDEDGISAFPALNASDTSYTIPLANITGANNSGGDVTIHAWIDFDGNGTFDADEYASTVLGTGTGISPNTDLVWNGLNDTVGGTTYARFRITNDPSIDSAAPAGPAINGEVEDYVITIPVKDWGDAPENDYPTTATNNGPSHVVTNDLYMGACIDDDADGQPAATANGDDSGSANGVTQGTCVTAGDDEDSLTPPTLTDGQTGVTVTVATNNTTGSDAYLACWVDYSGSGFEAAEKSAVVTVANGDTSAVITLPDVPADASSNTGGSTFMRCRLASDSTEIDLPTGVASNGEVEDYAVTINAALDWGDAPDPGYPTQATTGPSHVLNASLYMGACVDNETNGQQSATANGDDTGAAAAVTLGTCTTANDDEDSLTAPSLTDGQTAPTVTVNVVNSTGNNAYLACWVNYNANGFETGEKSATVTVPNGATSAVVTLPDVPTTASAATGGSSFMRCRLSSDTTKVALPTGAAPDGEVEDYPVTIGASKDWGDAPDASYSTLSVDNGPNHGLTPNLFMGSCVDDEANGQPTAAASGDDAGAANVNTMGTCATAGDDEDSLTPPTLTNGQLAPTVTVNVVNTTGANAYLACWVDYSGSGFDAAEKSVVATVANNATSVVVTLPNVPATASANTGGTTFMRCRLASNATQIANATGPATDGEVEDYPVVINTTYDWGDAQDPGYPTLSANGGPKHGLTPTLYMGACVDDENNGQQTTAANGDDTGTANLNTFGTCAVGGDDEDSLTPPTLTDGQTGATVSVVVKNTTGTNAYLACWVDYSGTGFEVAEKSATVTVPNNATTAVVTLPNVPATASGDTSGTSALRCRLAGTAAEVDNPTGTAAKGEVEDYVISIIPSEDWGDAPDASYPTLSANSGPHHKIDPNLLMGACVDDEADGQSSTTANGDDSGAAGANTSGTCATVNDDEDALTPPALIDGQVAPTVDVSVINNTGADAYLACWVDYSGSGFEVSEKSATVTVPNGATSATLTLPDVPATASNLTSGNSFMRCRLAGVATEVDVPTGAAAKGEVEDYPLTISPSLDWGDAPDPGYQTQAPTGPNHVLSSSLYMGACVDDEATSQQSAGANGDDAGAPAANTQGTCATPGADEDGLTPPSFIDGQVAPTVDVAVTNSTGGDANLVCWVDYSGSGFEATEKSATVTVPDGATSVTVTLPDVPANASTTTGGDSFMRCRLASDATEIANPVGPAADGEVEDYAILVSPSVDYGDAPGGDYPTTLADNGPRHLLDPDLYMGSCVDDEAEGQASVGADGDTGAAGAFTLGTCGTAGADEDGLTPPTLSPGQVAPSIEVAVVNNTGANAYLACWVDYSGTGFEPAERSTTVIVPNGATMATVVLPDVPADVLATTQGTSYLRCRLASNELEIADPVGLAANGEVEDYQFKLAIQEIPTLSQWALYLLMLMLGITGYRFARNENSRR